MERIDCETGNIVDTVENRIQNAILTAIDIFITHKFELAVRSKKKFPGRDATSATANSERDDCIGTLPLLILKTYPKGITRYRY